MASSASAAGRDVSSGSGPSRGRAGGPPRRRRCGRSHRRDTLVVEDSPDCLRGRRCDGGRARSSRAGCRGYGVNLTVMHVAVAHHVVAALERAACRARARRRSRRRRRARPSRSPRRGRSPSGCRCGSRPAACQAVRPRRRCQDCAGFASPAVKNAIRSSSAKAPWTTRSQAGLADAELGAHRRGLLVVELGQLGLEADGHGDRRRRRCAAACAAISGGTSSLALVDVDDEQHRLGGQRREVAQRVGRGLGHRDACAPGRPACSASIDARAATPPRRPPPCRRRARRARRARGGARPARGRRRSARSRSSRCRAAGRPRPPGGSTFASSWARTTWTIASVSRMLARNLLPRPSPSCAPRDEAGDVVEVDRVPARSRGADVAATCSRRSSRTGTIATFGSIVVNG